jgi:PKD repeat protein
LKKLLAFISVFCLILPLVFLGCGNGSDGSPGTSKGTISGTVTNSATSTGLEGATVKTSPDQGTATTAADGSYSLTVPAGVYTITYSRNGFATQTDAGVSILAGVSTTTNKTLIPTAPVIVDASVTGTATPGAALTASATPMVLDGSTVTGIVWSQKNSVTVTIDDNNAMTTGVTLPALAAYKDELFKVLAEPPAAGKLPEGVPLPPVSEEEYSGGLQDRFYVVGLNPLALEEAGLVTLVATVTTTSGTYEGEVEISTTLPWTTTLGINNVPVNVPVLIHGGTQGGTQTTWNWTISGGATLDNTTIQNPSFTPTTAGTYTVTETVSGESFDVVAGTWQGAITGEDLLGRPISTTCAPACHLTTGPNSIVTTIFNEWKDTGHAEIFTQNMDTPGGHWTVSCATCHGVGYNTAAVNNGWDEAMEDEGWEPPHTFGPGTWAGIIADYPEVARLANIQCENCHGPNNSALHMNGILMDSERESLSSDLCGSCHGEPARHGRYQQWQLSLHADYDLAIREWDGAECARCHTGNGFLAWGENYSWNPDNTLGPSDITWTDNTVHPQTCATCHDPHNIGTTTGEPTNAQVRISGDTPVLTSGWQALGVGRGAICMVCHNQRRGLTNDNWSFGEQGVALERSREPHHGPQSDILMGQSAFFIAVGSPGAHARVTDTCVRCHMEKTPPPADLSYALGGTNHTFYASPKICSECHTSIQDSSTVKSNTEGQLQLVGDLIGPATGQQITAIINSGDNVAIGSTILTAASLPVTGSNYVDGEMTITTVDNTYTGVALDDMRLNSSSGDRIALASEECQTLAKANWNYMIVVDDKSGGVHNPSFVAQFLAATYDVLLNTDFTVRNAVIKPLP